MKKINKYILGALFLSASLTSCIEETFPEGTTVTKEQVQTSATAVKSMALGLPARMNLVWNEDDGHCYFGYPAQMIIRDMMTNDYFHAGEVGYSHFISWGRNKNMGDAWLKTQFHWNYYYGNILTANNVIASVDTTDASGEQLAYYAVGKAYRALWYLDLARMYEFLPSDKFNGEAYKHILGVTVPLVDENTTAEQAGDNPRAPHATMFAFIEKDLNDAQKFINNLGDTNGNTLPDLACVYGLKARLYLWNASYNAEMGKTAEANADYLNAMNYAGLAIASTNLEPLTKTEALDTKTGYNKADKFMWAGVQTKENRSVTSGIINWASWVTNQTTFGYTGASTKLYLYIDKNMYNRIDNNDWRKLQWVSPDAALRLQNKFLSANDAENMPDYASLKFRPGEGNVGDNTIGAANDYPVMRVEEMYFIQAEAAEHLSPGDGKTMLETFMKSYRNPSYSCMAQDVIDEIIFQKRVELWGEGQTYFDIKRLNMPVVRGYEGTNWADAQCLLNTTTRPAWTTFVMVRSEANNNKALVGNNNPDPTDCYNPWVASK